MNARLTVWEIDGGHDIWVFRILDPSAPTIRMSNALG